MVKIALMAGALPLLAVACFSSSSAATKHADFYHCSANEVTTRDVEMDGSSSIETSGCGHQEVFVCIGAKCRSARLLAVRVFGAQLSCHEDQVRTEGGPNEFVASGCGKTAKIQCTRVPNEIFDCKVVP